MGLSSELGLDHHHNHWITGGITVTNTNTTISTTTSSSSSSTTNNNNNIIVRPSAISMKRQPSSSQQIGHSHVAQSEALNCPRCDSTNTKFCYYNNYNKTQPRHFCRACKRHWTRGGTLRNVPVGGARKNKRLKKSPSSSSAATDFNAKKSSEILYEAVPFVSPAAAATLQFSTAFDASLQFSAAANNDNNNVAQTTTSLHESLHEGFDYGWSFDDIDTLVSSDHIALPWEDYSLDILNP